MIIATFATYTEMELARHEPALVIGMIGGASILSEGLVSMKKGERYVTVRGVAEKEVKAEQKKAEEAKTPAPVEDQIAAAVEHLGIETDEAPKKKPEKKKGKGAARG